MIPQIILLTLMAMGLGINLVNHGEPKEGNNNVLYNIIATAVILGLLFWGGYFDKLLEQ